MTFPRMRAWVFGLLFVAWLGFLAYLAARTHGQVVVARPQVDRADVVVLASLSDDQGRPAAQFKVLKVLASKKPAWRELAGKDLDVKDLAFFGPKQGWTGPGEYVLPITRRTDGDEVTVLPVTPGYQAPTIDARVAVGNRPDVLAGRLAAWTGAPAPRIRELMADGAIRVWHVPVRSKEDLDGFKREVHESGGETLVSHPAEGRIYRESPDVMRQVDEIVGP